MVPVFTDDKLGLFQGDDELGSTKPPNSSTSSLKTNQTSLINNLNNNNNFGSYYPRNPSFSGVVPPIYFTGSTTSVNTRASSMNSILKPNNLENVLSTEKREHISLFFSKSEHTPQYLMEDKNINDNESYNLSNNYDYDNE